MLSEGEYTVMATDRGGVTPLGEITQVSSLQFNRVRDETSTATIQINNPSAECCGLLADLRTVRHEIVLQRNGKRCWEGPITRLEYGVGEAEIAAADITFYTAHRTLEHLYDYSGISAPAVIGIYDMLQQHYPPTGDPFNIGQFLTRIESADDPKTAAKYPAFSRSVFNILETYAAHGGVDYTVNGRRLMIYGTHTRVHVLPRMTDEHLSDSVKVSEYGSELFTRNIITNSEGAVAVGVAEQEWLDYYGNIDQVDNNPDEGDGEPDDTDLADMAEMAEKHLRSGYPAPIRVWLPANSRLDPCYPVEFHDLIAGAWVPLESTGTCRQLTQWQKLNSITVNWAPGSESVNISLVNAPRRWSDASGIVTAT